MNFIFYANIVIVNIVAWLAISYFWSFWNFKLFKPYQWLESVKRKTVSRVIVHSERKFKDRNRFYTIWFVLEGLRKKNIEGDLAEVGVFKGETAKVIHHLMPERSLYLFDSFSGLPAQVIREDCDGTVRPQTVNFEQTSKEEVEKYMKGNHRVEIREGIFPDTAADLKEHTFAFVHLDADLYKSTLDGLQFFYPRLAPGGSVLVHDYNHNWEGVRKAVDEFEMTVPEQFVELYDMYGSVLLTKNKL
ncbi:TylF/MycF/NovP-related O-methyltransferase [Saccharicrinis fermentans]|uniref:Macrocin-O-methyltransferase n=1 Tax=Saccharicrinis fermentans DSM 9555 = JCM 21142 TaxID=869213 RepID=W7YM94_9BACT|nr:TylF/MycF/NovP-related O-methyltransferase [Saccharicrinis fermentans]GAF05786.1 macrocin-O-methyltransferase [Saccharicrinis fermentans DSM 9555 = JCM 21142]